MLCEFLRHFADTVATITWWLSLLAMAKTTTAPVSDDDAKTFLIALLVFAVSHAWCLASAPE